MATISAIEMVIHLCAYLARDGPQFNNGDGDSFLVPILREWARLIYREIVNHCHLYFNILTPISRRKEINFHTCLISI